MTDFSPIKGANEDEINATIEQIIRAASLQEKVDMMSGRGFFQAMKDTNMRWGGAPYRAGGGIQRLGVPALFFTDGPRGVVRGNSTCFPVTMARGASWDRDLERKIGEVMGVEARAQGCNLSGAVCVNLLRHPAWGRAQETYGEDPFHLGEMGAALSRGIQTHNVAATVKHYALNSIENARFKIDVRIAERSLREVYLPHFKRILDAGCATVMSAYNKVNGEYCGQNRYLLTDILRHDWGFEGAVHSDWMLGVYHPYGAAAGLDIENPEPVHFGDKLIDAVSNGQIEPSVVDTAARRILRTIYRFACAEDPLPAYAPDLVACEAHTRVALEAAEKSAVLLHNNGILPLRKTANVGLFGSLAARSNTGDNGSSKVSPPYCISALEGIANYLGDSELLVAGDEQDVQAAAQAAAVVDVAIVVVGTTAFDEGEYVPSDIGQSSASSATTSGDNTDGHDKMLENTGAFGAGQARGGDRDRLRLPEHQLALVKAVAGVNANTIVVIQSGSAIISTEFVGSTAAVLQTFYSGMEGGTALAHLLYGAVSPSGKLPFTVAMDESDYPFFDKHAKAIDYDNLHGYGLLESQQKAPQFPFGFGLSYAAFSYRALRVRRTDHGVEVSVSLCNTGSVTASEITQIYVGFPNSAVPRTKLLKGFERTELAPGVTKTLDFLIPFDDLKYWDVGSHGWRLEPGVHTLFAGGSSDEASLLQGSIRL